MVMENYLVQCRLAVEECICKLGLVSGQEYKRVREVVMSCHFLYPKLSFIKEYYDQSNNQNKISRARKYSNSESAPRNKMLPEPNRMHKAGLQVEQKRKNTAKFSVD